MIESHHCISQVFDGGTNLCNFFRNRASLLAYCLDGESCVAPGFSLYPFYNSNHNDICSITTGDALIFQNLTTFRSFKRLLDYPLTVGNSLFHFSFIFHTLSKAVKRSQVAPWSIESFIISIMTDCHSYLISQCLILFLYFISCPHSDNLNNHNAALYQGLYFLCQ